MPTTPEYEAFHALFKRRISVRKFKPDPIPDDYIEKILEAGRWAQSGANSQPWEFIVVKDPDMKKKLYETYSKVIKADFCFWMEQIRRPELRHPYYHPNVMKSDDPDEQLKQIATRGDFAQAPAIIVVLGDGRRQWGTVLSGFTHGRHQTHFTDGLSNSCHNIHLAAAALGIGAQWVTIEVQEPFKRLLGVPDLLTLFLLIPIGYPAMEWRPGYRRELKDMVHYDHYDMKKYLSNREIVDYVRSLRERTVGIYKHSRVDQ
jgi:nitroreductase